MSNRWCSESRRLICEQKGHSSDEENALPTRSAARGGRNGEGSAGAAATTAAAGKEELDSSVLIGADEARKKFRKAERKRGARVVVCLCPIKKKKNNTATARSRARYAYPPSPDSPPPGGGSSHASSDPTNPRPVPLSHRLRALQAELAALELELADPSNPLLSQEREEHNVDPGELIRGLVDVRGRLERIRKGKEGRGKLVGMVAALGETGSSETRSVTGRSGRKTKTVDDDDVPDVRSVVEMDRRVGDLEKLVGSSGAALDDVWIFFFPHSFARCSIMVWGPAVTPPAPVTPPDHASPLATDAAHATATH